VRVKRGRMGWATAIKKGFRVRGSPEITMDVMKKGILRQSSPALQMVNLAHFGS